jgi:hypothetical protein
MKIIAINPNSDGSYSQVQTWDGAEPKDGFVEITADTSEYFNGFVIPTYTDGKITSFACNTEAWEAWKAADAAATAAKIESPTVDELARVHSSEFAMIYAQMTAMKTRLATLEGA